MLFDTPIGKLDAEHFESFKERNLYYKFFAGYFANELVKGWENRFMSLVDLVGGKYGKLGRLVGPLDMNPKHTHLSFDNHIAQYLNGSTTDRGEFSDVFFYDCKTRNGIAIEVKYLSPIGSKDIYDNPKRWEEIKGKRPIAPIKGTIYPIFLISEKSASFEKDTKQIKRIQKPYITWQELLKRTGPRTECVKTYVAEMLKKGKRESWIKLDKK
jgi:hypothetical protein